MKRDLLEAAKWYSKAAEAGDESAVGSLGGIGRDWRFLTQNPINLTPNPIIYELVEKAAKRGNAIAQFSLGVMNYPLGFGAIYFDESTGNLREALIWYRRAAEQGDVDLQVALGIAYEDGIGVPQDYRAAGLYCSSQMVQPCSASHNICGYPYRYY